MLRVHDRHRTAAGGRDAATLGVWLDEGAPMMLGPMACGETPPVPSSADAFAAALAPTDARLTTRYSSIANTWRAAVTLRTSQAVITFRPTP